MFSFPYNARKSASFISANTLFLGICSKKLPSPIPQYALNARALIKKLPYYVYAIIFTEVMLRVYK